MEIRKYEFASLANFLTKAAALLPEDSDFASHPDSTPFSGIGCTIMKLVVETTPAVLDAEGNVVTPAVVSPKFHVDICFDGDAPAALEANAVWPEPNGQHMFLGWNEWYTAEYEKRK